MIEGKKTPDDIPIDAVPPAAVPLSPDSPCSGNNGRYPQPLAHYASVYGQSDRTIKRWISKGKKATDPPPLDFPGDMPAWFARHHKHRVPDWLLELGAKARDAVPPPQSDEPESPAPATYVAPTELPIGLGFEAELVRVREEARKAAALLSEAETGRIVSEIDAARRQYDRTLKLLREYERDAPKILASMGNLVDRAVYEALILTKHSAIRAESEAMYTVELHRALRAAPDYEAARRIHVEAYHEILRSLTTGGFGDKEVFALDAT